jgi:hypothetical protein
VVLVFCEGFDHSALWAAGRLGERGTVVDVVSADDLAAAECWDHRLGAAGTAITIQLTDGRRVTGDDRCGVLNRLSYLPAAWLRRVGGPDRDYALQEMYALYVSWLHALKGPVMNRPTPQGLCGNWRHPSIWMLLAARAGLPVPRFCQSSDDDPALSWQSRTAPTALTAFVAGRHVVAPPALPIGLREPCRRLADAAGVTLLGVDFEPDSAGIWRFASASVMPNLMAGGDALIDALAETLSA